MHPYPIRVLHLLWDGDLGGVQRYLIKVIGSPHWQGVEHAICFFRSPGKVFQTHPLPGVKVFALDLDRGWQIFKARALHDIVAHWHPEVIHCHCDTPAFMFQVDRFTAQRLVYTEHGDTMMRDRREWVSKLLWRWQGACWDAIVLNSDFVRADFIRRYPHLEALCTVLPNPLIDLYEGARQFDPTGVAHIGVFCRLVPQKGVDRMLEVAALLRSHVKAFRLHVWGEGGELPALQQQTQQLGLEDIVTFEGYSQHPLQKMVQMDCVVVPSRIEPFGLVALEAQGCGVPVVAFRPSGVAEVVRDGVSGLLVEQGDLTGMAQAIATLLTARPLNLEMGRQAKEYSRSTFCLERHIEQLEAIYRGEGGSSPEGGLR